MHAPVIDERGAACVARWTRPFGRFAYDALNQLTAITVPTINASDHGARFGYDLVGHRITATEDNNVYVNASFDWFGNQVSETSRYGGTKTMGYDLAGHMTRLAWSDGVAVGYQYDATGALTSAVDGGGQPLFNYSYDDLGRPTTLCRAQNQQMCTQYVNDSGNRLTGLNLLAASGGVNYQFGGYNPAGEIGQRTSSNDDFAFGGAVATNRPYTTNGLNQYATIASKAQGYDGRGNLTSSGEVTYSYDTFNRLGEYLGGQQAGKWFYYDAVGRLNWSQAANTRFDYVGNRLVAELDGAGKITKRYIYGTEKAPIVAYEGLGNGPRSFYETDERGSVVWIRDATGASVKINSYDEFGIPASGNQGRFQYTGQVWLPEVGLYYYKARMYSPTLGRFMQTDRSDTTTA